jgi:hypothetical protein
MSTSNSLNSTTSPSTAVREAVKEIASHFNENTLWHVGELTVATMIAIISKHCCGGREAEIRADAIGECVVTVKSLFRKEGDPSEYRDYNNGVEDAWIALEQLKGEGGSDAH